MRRQWILAATLAALASGVRIGAGQAEPKPVQESARRQLVKGLPDASAIGGAAVGEPAFFGDNLYEYIDGGAEVYHQYQFAGLVHQKYRIGDVELTVDVYDMGNALNAFGIYASERAPDYHYVPIGAEGYLNDPVMNFFQGAFYVKLAAAGQTARSARVLDSAARNISAKIGTGKALPEAFALFPTAGRVPRSERFVRTAPLGHDYLAPMYQVDYIVSGKKVTLALSETGTPRDALARAAKLQEHFAAAGKVIASTATAAGAFRGSSRYDGDMLWAAKGRAVALLIGAAPGGDDLFKTLLAKLPAQ